MIKIDAESNDNKIQENEGTMICKGNKGTWKSWGAGSAAFLDCKLWSGWLIHANLLMCTWNLCVLLYLL